MRVGDPDATRLEIGLTKTPAGVVIILDWLDAIIVKEIGTAIPGGTVIPVKETFKICLKY